MSRSLAATTLAPGRPYAERAEEREGWHDTLALRLAALASPLLAPLQRLRPGSEARIAEAAASHREALQALDDMALRARADALRPALRAQGFTLANAALAFALIGEAAARTLGQRHYPSQQIAGFAMLRGRLAEMATGEGKTFAATLPACTAALAGMPVHVITVNDYLAQRDAEKMAPLYRFFGFGVGVVVQGLPKPERRRAYAQPITYCTNKELAFDYLRDRVACGGQGSALHLALRRLGDAADEEPLVLRGLHFALVDEADSVFIDEARTPLILSQPAGEGEAGEADCTLALELAATLERGVDYRLHPFDRRLALTPEGKRRLEDWAEGQVGEWAAKRTREDRVTQALCALHLYERDQHYVVAEGKVQIVDESTGRVMPDRSWERGLHQMIEAKEGCALTARRETLARLTYQRLFRRYLHLGGMTGTAAEVAREIRSVYRLRTQAVPLHRPSRRRMLAPTVCLTLEQKWRRVAERVQQLQREGRAVLVGTRSVQASEQVSEVLHALGVAHELLNAKQDRAEAEVVTRAGQPGAVTVATNMAGRGTDIELHPEVERLGGLHVILTEFHETARVDRQLFGRAARQGDPGSCEAIVAIEDEIFSVCAPRATAVLRTWLRVHGRLPPLALQALRRLAQAAAERRNTAMRRHNAKMDERLARLLAFSGRGE